MWRKIKPQVVHRWVHFPAVVSSRGNLSHQECYSLFFNCSCYINWWLKVGGLASIRLRDFYTGGYFLTALRGLLWLNHRRVKWLCWCIYSSHSAQLENKQWVLLWAWTLPQAHDTHTCLVVQVADGTILMGCNGNRLGRMADHTVNQLAACRGR